MVAGGAGAGHGRGPLDGRGTGEPTRRPDAAPDRPPERGAAGAGGALVAGRPADDAPHRSIARTAHGAVARRTASPPAPRRRPQALERIGYPWRERLPDWTVTFLPGRAGLLGGTWTYERRIEIYVRDTQSVRGRRLHARPRAGSRRRRDPLRRGRAPRVAAARGLDPDTPLVGGERCHRLRLGRGRLGGGVRGPPPRWRAATAGSRASPTPPNSTSSPASPGPDPGGGKRRPGRKPVEVGRIEGGRREAPEHPGPAGAEPQPMRRVGLGVRQDLVGQVRGHRVVVVVLEGEAAPAAGQRAQVDGVAQQLGGGHAGPR